jgi:hypothetical protein
MVHRPAVGACAIHAAVKPNGPRPPAPVFVVPPLASQLGMPPVTLDAERERSTMEAGPPIRAESDWAVSAAPDSQRPTRSNPICTRSFRP